MSAGSSAFGRLLRDRRAFCGLTQQQLAGLSTLSVRAIRDLERGRATRPRSGTVRLLADGLGLRGQQRESFEAAATPVGAARRLREQFGRMGPPAPTTGLIGREAELTAVTDLMLVDGHRAVTLTGLAGVGKTRLAVDVATAIDELGRPVLWPDHIGDIDRLSTVVGDRDLIVVLDGAGGHVRVGDAVVLLLRQCPRAQVLATASVPLGLCGECVVPVLPLPVPADNWRDDVQCSPSVRLLVRQMRAVNPMFRLGPHNAAAVVEVCRRCGGYPRLIEAAALWCGLRSPRQMLRWRGTGQVHESVSHSVGTLAVRERRTLDRLARLTGPWSIDEAASQTGAEPAETVRAVHALSSRGLLSSVDDLDCTRYRLLDAVRSWATARQESVTA